jgi:peptidoglycan hydrolase-like protein with peptidoglycan-binding domain
MPVNANDLAAPVRWQESLRRSQKRRATAARRRRRRFNARTLVAVAALALVTISGVALASGGTSSGATLSVGSSGPAVKKLQRKLGVSVTGYYGTQTRRAVKRYQAAHGLEADGVAGPETLAALGIHVRGASYSTGGTSYSGGGSSVRLPAELRRIARCESGGNPQAVSRSGRYRGKYQFDRATWRAAGGSGDPAAAPESVQDRIALALYRREGTAPWPNCA